MASMLSLAVRLGPRVHRHHAGRLLKHQRRRLVGVFSSHTGISDIGRGGVHGYRNRIAGSPQASPTLSVCSICGCDGYRISPRARKLLGLNGPLVINTRVHKKMRRRSRHRRRSREATRDPPKRCDRRQDFGRLLHCEDGEEFCATKEADEPQQADERGEELRDGLRRQDLRDVASGTRVWLAASERARCARPACV